MDETIKQAVKWILINVVLVMAILFFLALCGIEFIEYPHKTIKLTGADYKHWDNYIICSNWNDEKVSLAVSYDFNGNKTECNDYDFIENIEEGKLIYYGNLQIIVRDITNYNNQIEIELVYLIRSFFLVGGNDISSYFQ